MTASRTSRLLPLVALAAGFVASRAGYHLMGVRFDTSPLLEYWQYLDVQLLRDDLFTSIWHLHMQPPLYNLLLGGVLEMATGEAGGAFHAVALAAGFGLALVFQRLLVRLGVPAWPATAVALGLASLPATVLYETWLYVEYLVAFFIALGALFAWRFGSSRRPVDAAGLFGSLAVVVLSRTLFHLAFIVGCLVVVAWLARRDAGAGGRRQGLRAVALGAALPVLLCGFWFTKQLVQFGVPTSMSCSGLNLGRVSTFLIPEGERRRLVDEGVLSEYALIGPFTLPRDKPELFAAHAASSPTGVAALDRAIRTGGGANFNHEVYLDVCPSYISDAATTARRRPDVVMSAMRMSTLTYLRPPSDYTLFAPANLASVHDLERITSIAVYGQFVEDRAGGRIEDFLGPSTLLDRLAEIGWFTLVMYPVAVVVMVRGLRREPDPGLRMLYGYVLATVAWVTVVGNAAEAGENNRFRFLTDGLVIVVLVAAAVRARWRRAPAPS